MKNKNIIAIKNLIRCLDLENLKNPEVVVNLVRAFGIVQWGPPVFGEDERFKNASPDMAGIYQTPDQIAKALVYLSEFEINSYCEVGTFQGGNFIFVSEYLRRFNPDVRCLTIDPTNYLNAEVKEIIDAEEYLSFQGISSDEMAGQKFDLCFLDGDHTAKWIEKDWENVGRHAKICMFHDIQETTCPDIVEFWKKIKITKKKTIEFLDYTSEVPLQGIGIIHNAKIGSKA
jgi:hypothetical protein